jgi:hypothetical protein
MFAIQSVFILKFSLKMMNGFVQIYRWTSSCEIFLVVKWFQLPTLGRVWSEQGCIVVTNHYHPSIKIVFKRNEKWKKDLFVLFAGYFHQYLL